MADGAGAGITLDNVGANVYGTLRFNSTGAVNIVENNATNLAGTNTANTLVLTSAGSISDNAGASLVVANAANLADGAGAGIVHRQRRQYLRHTPI